MKCGSARRGVAALVLLSVGAVVGAAARPYAGSAWRSLHPETSPPQPKIPALWNAKVGQFELLDGAVDLPDLVYVGDSITDWMMVTELVRVEGGRVLNRAVSGDSTAGVLARLERSFPSGAAVCILLVGYNDVSQGASAGETASRIREICGVLLGRHGARHIVLESLLPVAGPDGSTIIELNARLRAFADTQASISYLDLHTDFLEDGEPDASLFSGAVHLNVRGVVKRLARERDHLRRVTPDLPVETPDHP